jgi:1,4-dihydroxy-2-naphthoyl-CoA hydrolase
MNNLTLDSPRALKDSQAGRLPDLLGLDWSEARPGFVSGRFDVKPHHLAPCNDFLHAASVVGLLDTACGFGCLLSMPHGAAGFTTMELKVNFLGTARMGSVTCEARLVHSGRTTQVWDAEAKAGDPAKTIALFRCTQMLLYLKF